MKAVIYARTTCDLDRELYKNGICQCKAAGKWKYQHVGSRYLLICVKCGRPKYWLSN